MINIIITCLLIYAASVMICFIGRSVVKKDPIHFDGKDAFIIFFPVVNAMCSIIMLIKLSYFLFWYACEVINDLIME